MGEDIRMKPIANDSDRSGPVSKESDDGDYDPHLYRETAHPTTNMETTVHLLKGCLGTGILAMPEAFKNAGMVVGFIGTLFIGWLCTYGLHILVDAQYVLCKRYRIPLLTYPESMRIALQSGPECLKKYANFAAILVDIFLILYQVGVCCVYVVFVGVNLKGVIDQYISSPIAVEYYILATLLPHMLIISIRNLKILAPFSTLANVLTVIAFGVILYYIFRENLDSITERKPTGHLYYFPLFFGTVLFALEAVGVVITLENNMQNPKDFGSRFGVLNVSMFIITLLYVGAGFLGYWKYGEDSLPSITLNIPQKDVLAQVINCLYLVAIFISYGLQGYVPVDILWNGYIVKRLENSQSQHMLFWEYMLRLGIVIVTFIMATTIPLLGLFISLIGAFCLSGLGLAFPGIMDICCKWPGKFGRCNWILIRDVILIILGIVGLCSGSYSAISEIVINLTKKS